MHALSHTFRGRSALLVAGILAVLGPVPASLGQQESGRELPAPAAPSETKPRTAPVEGLAPPFALPYPCPAGDGDGSNPSRPELSIDRYHPAPPPEPGPDPCWHFIAEGGFSFVQPYFSHNPAFTINRPQGTNPASPSTAQTQDFDYFGHFAPWVMLAVVNPDGWGLRASWWYYNQSGSTPFLTNQDKTGRTTVASAPVAGIPGFSSPSTVGQSFGVVNDRFDFSDHLRLDVYDWEGFRDFRCECWSLLVSGGVRYVDLSQRYDAYRFNSGTGRSGTTSVTVREDSDTATSGHEFVGLGPTAALEGHWQLGWGLGLYGVARGSVLFGRDKMQSFQRTVETRVVTPSGGRAQTIATSALFGGDEPARGQTLPMGDFEAGGEWVRPFRGTSLFLRLGLVNENWFGAGTATSDHGNLVFFGMRLSTGITY